MKTKKYGAAFISLPAGRYTRKDIEALLKWFDDLDKKLERSMRETK